MNLTHLRKSFVIAFLGCTGIIVFARVLSITMNFVNSLPLKYQHALMFVAAVAFVTFIIYVCYYDLKDKILGP